MQIDELSDETVVEVQTSVEGQAMLTVEPSPNPSNSQRQTLKLLAQIGKHSVLLLVDSGSIGTFVMINWLNIFGFRPFLLRQAYSGLLMVV